MRLYKRYVVYSIEIIMFYMEIVALCMSFFIYNFIVISVLWLS